jgi:uncharacterized PurR-regulated membrane protein YhhQ (DUF165 family)
MEILIMNTYQPKDLMVRESPYLFAILMAINVVCYTLCTVMMVKIIEPGVVSVVSLFLMVAAAVLGVRIGFKLNKAKHTALGIGLGGIVAAAGVVLCVLDVFDKIAIPGFEVPASFTGDYVFFTTTYMLSDIFSEVFGYKASRISCTTSALVAVAVGLIGKGLTLISAPEWAAPNQDAFQFIYGGAFYSTIAGVLIYAIGDYINDRVFRKLKNSSKASLEYGSFAYRSMLSSACGKILDLALFSMVVMVPLSTQSICDALGITSWGMGTAQLFGNFCLGISMQITLEVILSPVTYKITRIIRNKLTATPQALNS